MNNIVAKFGGSSLSDAAHFRQVKQIIETNEYRKFIVVSAPGKRFEKDAKITDLLLSCFEKHKAGQSFTREFNHIKQRYVEIINALSIDIDLNTEFEVIQRNIESGFSSAYVASRGEYLCAIILSAYLGRDFIDSKACIYFDSCGKIDVDATDRNISEVLSVQKNAVIPGFYGTDIQGNIITFPRNGSDITGALIARGINADVYENWTDVDGFMKSDPTIVSNPKIIRQLSFQELRDLSYMGASILHEDAIFPVSSKNIPIHILNTNSPDDSGTWISEEFEDTDDCLITGVVGKSGFAIVHMEKELMNDEIGYARQLLQILEEFMIPLEHMACGIDSISLLVREESIKGNTEKIKERIKEVCNPDHFSIHDDMSLISVVGRKLKRDQGVGKAKIFGALAKHGINSWLVDQGASSSNIFVGVDSKDQDDAIRAIYDEFV